jgi:class 3 adenylate cyclase
MSDPLPSDGYGIEEVAADAIAVLDAAGFDRVVLFASGVGGAVAIWLAVHNSERIAGLIFCDASVSLAAHDGYDVGFDEAALRELRAFYRSVWGTGATIAVIAPTQTDDEHLRAEWARYECVAATPNTAVRAFDLCVSLDARDLLAHVAVPTLVIHSDNNVAFPLSHGRYIAAHIPDAHMVETEGDSSWTTFGNVVGDVSEFLTGRRTGTHITRSLQVVVFTDIADSTGRAATMGDAAWRDLLHSFRNLVRDVLARHEAREVNTRGDDFFAVVASPSVAVEIARLIRAETAKLGLHVRTGMHLGEVEQHGDDYAGIAVHIGARIEALAAAGDILVSQTVRDALAGSNITCTSRGEQRLKGVPGEWQIFAVDN